MRLGAHVSVAGGVHRAVERAANAGCDALQIFVKSSRAWAARDLEDDEVEAFRQGRRRAGLDPAVAHASYLLNLASGDRGLWERSWKTCALELRRCALLQLDGLVLHPGSHGGAGADRGLERVARGLEKVLAAVDDGPPLLLENTAGQGTALGADLAELAWLLERLGDRRVGICLDTCHLHAAGYALGTPEACATSLEHVAGTVGFDRVATIHCNDSRTPAGSRVDRHAHIGTGTIGAEGFAALLADERVRALPGILETPTGDDGEWIPVNLERLRCLVRGEAPPPPPDAWTTS